MTWRASRLRVVVTYGGLGRGSGGGGFRVSFGLVKEIAVRGPSFRAGPVEGIGGRSSLARERRGGAGGWPASGLCRRGGRRRTDVEDLAVAGGDVGEQRRSAGAGGRPARRPAARGDQRQEQVRRHRRGRAGPRRRRVRADAAAAAV